MLQSFVLDGVTTILHTILRPEASSILATTIGSKSEVNIDSETQMIVSGSMCCTPYVTIVRSTKICPAARPWTIWIVEHPHSANKFDINTSYYRNSENDSVSLPQVNIHGNISEKIGGVLWKSDTAPHKSMNFKNGYISFSSSGL